MKHREDYKDENIKLSKSRFAVLILTFLITLASILLVYDLYVLRALESFIKYLNVLTVLVIVIWLVLLIKTKKRFRKKHKKNFKNKGLIIFEVIYFIIIAIVSAVITYFYVYLGNFNKETVTYSSSLVVLSENKADNIKKLKNYNIAILSDKSSPEGYIIPREVIKKYKLEDYNNIKDYDNYSSMVADLYSGDIDAIFINTDYAKTYSTIDDYKNIETETKIIFTQEKKMQEVKTNKRKTSSSGKKVTEPFTILLLGVDSINEGLDKNTVALGDSIMLITFNPKTLNATLLSVPRDSYVPIACWSSKAENKITHAAAYGTDCMISTIENYFDVTIDYYAKINFKGLVHLVDALGGIDVEVPARLCTDDSNRWKQVCIDPGFQHLDGEGALVLSRNRKQLTNGDIGRGQNQQIVIKAMIDKIKSIKSAGQFLNILNTVSINIDTNFTQDQILSFYNIAEDLMTNNLAKDDVDLVNIQQLYLQGDGEMIYDENSRLVLWDYIPNKDSRKDIIKAMKMNLGLVDHETNKSFSFSINEEYEKELVGYGPYKTSYLYDLVPNFVGLSKEQATNLANKKGIKITLAGGNGYVISQSVPANKRLDKLAGSVTLTLGGTKEEKKTTKKTCVKEKDTKTGKYIYYDKTGKEVEEEDYNKSCKVAVDDQKDDNDDDNKTDEKDDKEKDNNPTDDKDLDQIKEISGVDNNP